jgi:hypothetical protein
MATTNGERDPLNCPEDHYEETVMQAHNSTLALIRSIPVENRVQFHAVIMGILSATVWCCEKKNMTQAEFDALTPMIGGATEVSEAEFNEHLASLKIKPMKIGQHNG